VVYALLTAAGVMLLKKSWSAIRNKLKK